MNKELKKTSVKSKVEAIIFSTGNRISLDEISKLCRSNKEDVLAALHELKNEYDDKQSSLMLVEEGEFWKFTVRDHLIPIVRKIVTETELSKSVLETLAVIAYKYPILQSDIIKLRTNKAYDHLVELESSGYISRQKHGRTNLIKLTEKFFKYFDLTEEQLKEQFKDFDSIARAIKQKEEEVEKIKEDQVKKADELKQQDEKIRKEIETLDEAGEEFEVPLETYNDNNKPEKPQEQDPLAGKNKLGQLEIIDSEKETLEEVHKEEKTSDSESKTKKRQEIAEKENTNQESQGRTPNNENKKTNNNTAGEDQERKTKNKKRNKGIKLTPEMESEVDKKVEEIINPAKNKEDN